MLKVTVLTGSGNGNYSIKASRPFFYLMSPFRICSGMNIANQALFIDFACLLWAVNIQQAHDREGNPIIPSRTDVVDEGLVV